MKALVVFALAAFVAASPLLAQETPAPTPQPQEPEGPRYTIFTKFFRGIGNIIMSPFEIPVTAFNVSADTDVFIGVSLGAAAGVGAGIERLACGALDMATFLFPPYDRPLLTHTIGKSPVGNAIITTFPREP